MNVGKSKRGQEPLQFEGIYPRRRVLVTGHTGFTGGWLCRWLLGLEARITGIALPPETQPNLFDALGLERGITSIIGDISDTKEVERAFETGQPEIVFHLAAQPLVKKGYDEPEVTFRTTVLGTMNILEAARSCPATRAVVFITTDQASDPPQPGRSFLI